MPRPNILWICTDQQRFDTIRALGNPRIRTPQIDQLVKQGVALTQAYAQSPVCTPSRAAMLTGRYPRTTRCRQNGQQIPSDERLLPRMLADHGYVCGLAGKLHLGSCANGRVEQRIDDGYEVFHWSHHPQPDWVENAYTQWLAKHGKTWEELYTGEQTRFTKRGIPAEYHQTTWCAEMATDFIHENAGRKNPWLFSVNFYAPHHPFDPPGEYLDRYDPAEMPLPKYKEGELENKPEFQKLDHIWAHNTPGYYPTGEMTPDEARQVIAAYYAMIEHIDHEVGRMLQVLEDTGQRENTIVIFMSDHGEMLGDHGLLLKGPHFYEEAVRVPLILRWPGHFQVGLKADGLVELVDLVPTLLECAGLPIEPQIQGRSLLPVLKGEADASQIREFVYSEYLNAWTHPEAYATMLRTRNEKIVVYHGTELGELYDLASDPDEFENLWDYENHAKRKTRLLKMTCDAIAFTVDPLPKRLGPF